MTEAKTVYLVDDDDDDRLLIREALHSVIDSVQIVEIVNGEELIRTLEKERESKSPSLILMDMNMPRMSGLEALVLIKSNPRLVHIPIVMISTTSEHQLILKAYDQGINAFITKPVSVAEFEQLAYAINICFLQHYVQASNGSSLSRRLKGKSILIIEDDDDHWQLIGQGLTRTLPEVNIVRTVDQEDTLAYLNTAADAGQSIPQLIILDLYLPTKEHGLGLLGQLRRFFLSQKMPAAIIIVYSSSGQQQDIKESYANGANAYMVKMQDLTQSVSHFKDLCYFWWDTVSRPGKF